METGKGYLASLFDFSFSELITKKIIRILYFILVLAIGLGALAFMVAGFSQSFFTGLGYTVGAAFFFLIYVTLIRVALEIYIVIFRIADYTKEIAEQGRGAGGHAPPPMG